MITEDSDIQGEFLAEIGRPNKKEKQNESRQKNFYSVENLEMPEGYHPFTTFILQMGKWMNRECVLGSERQGEQPWRMRKRSWLVDSDHSRRSIRLFNSTWTVFFSLLLQFTPKWGWAWMMWCWWVLKSHDVVTASHAMSLHTKLTRDISAFIPTPGENKSGWLWKDYKILWGLLLAHSYLEKQGKLRNFFSSFRFL